jgi:ornithine cyclodeaminase/alanine dehydrogenase
MGAKLFGLGRAKAANHLIVLFDQATGKLAALVDGGLATAFRTAATSAVAIDRLAKPGPLRVGLLGSGVEAHHHLEALASIREIASVKVFSPRAANREAFAATFGDTLGIAVTAEDTPQAAIGDMDVVVAAARANGEQPILLGSWIAPDQIIASIGSTLPEQRELDVSVIEGADLIVCDTLDEVVEETGDMIAALAAGQDISGKLMSLNEAMQPSADTRIAGARYPLYKSVGSGLQDVIVAELALERAVAAGLAQQSAIHLHTRHPGTGKN